MHKTFFFLTIFFLYLNNSLGGYNRNKTRPRRPKPNFKKVGAIPCGCNTKWTYFYPNVYIWQMTLKNPTNMPPIRWIVCVCLEENSVQWIWALICYVVRCKREPAKKVRQILVGFIQNIIEMMLWRWNPYITIRKAL